MASNSTSKLRVELGGITGGNPRGPYPKSLPTISRNVIIKISFREKGVMSKRTPSDEEQR